MTNTVTNRNQLKAQNRLLFLSFQYVIREYNRNKLKITTHYWTDYILSIDSKFIQILDHHIALKTHLYRHELQQQRENMIDKCPSKDTHIHLSKKENIVNDRKT